MPLIHTPTFLEIEARNIGEIWHLSNLENNFILVLALYPNIGSHASFRVEN